MNSISSSLLISESDKELFDSINVYSREYMSQPHYDNSHDYQHILRVLSNAHKILLSESETSEANTFDPMTVYLAALLHDVGDHKYAKVGEDIENIVSSVLIQNGATKEFALKIQTIVKNVGWTNEKRNPESVLGMIEQYPELAIVQDADRLDAIGAVGVGRCFAYTGAKCQGRPMMDAIEHFEDKLYKLATAMKTETGKKMAQERQKVLKDFAAQFVKESKLSFEL